VRYPQLILVAVIAIEVVIGVRLYRRQKPPVTPVAVDLSHVDSFTAAHINELAANCHTADGWANLGEVYLAYGYFTEAEACYRVAVERQPSRTDWVHHWGFALERIGRLAEANAQYERAIELGHLDPSGCWYYIGRNHLRLENLDAARAAFAKAGEQPSARYETARLLARAGQGEEALPILERLEAEYPNAVQPPLLRHKILLLKGDAAATAAGVHSMYAPGGLPTPFDADWKWLEEVHDNTGLARELKSSIALFERGETEAAASGFREVFRRNGDAIAADFLAVTEERSGNADEATRQLEEAIAKSGPTPHLLIRLGETEAARGRMKLAVEAWTRATHLGSGGAVKDAHHRLAEYYEKTGNSAEARRHHALAYFAAGHEAFWTVRPAPAQSAFETALNYDPTFAAAWFYLGEMHRLQDKPNDARKAYERCLSIDANFGRAITSASLLPTK
jgi:tetratricopeptide (TPR) repeat protein